MRIYLTKVIHFEDGSKPIITRLGFGKDLSYSFKDFLIYAIRNVACFFYEFAVERTFPPCGYGYDQDGRICYIVSNTGHNDAIRIVSDIKITFTLKF